MKPIEGRASITFSSSTTRSRWIGSGSTGCCGPKGMIVRAMIWVLGFGGGWQRGGCYSGGRRGRCGRGGSSRLHCRRFGAPERKLHGRLIQVAVEIHRHAIDLHVEQIVQFVFIEECAPVDGSDTWHSGTIRRHLETEVRQAAFAVKAVRQFHILGQAGGAG